MTPWILIKKTKKPSAEVAEFMKTYDPDAAGPLAQIVIAKVHGVGILKEILIFPTG